MKLILPIKAVNTSNSREHWAAVAARTKAHRNGCQIAMAASCSIYSRREWVSSGAIVTLTRVAPRALDDDGNVTSLKAVRDGVADALGLKSDNDPRVRWAYAQRRGKVREYAVEIEIEAAP